MANEPGDWRSSEEGRRLASVGAQGEGMRWKGRQEPVFITQ